jgi:hypothetical protein
MPRPGKDPALTGSVSWLGEGAGGCVRVRSRSSVARAPPVGRAYLQDRSGRERTGAVLLSAARAPSVRARVCHIAVQEIQHSTAGRQLHEGCEALHRHHREELIKDKMPYYRSAERDRAGSRSVRGGSSLSGTARRPGAAEMPRPGKDPALTCFAPLRPAYRSVTHASQPHTLLHTAQTRTRKRPNGRATRR